MANKLKGSIVALVTPFKKGKVDFDTMIDAQIRLLHLELKGGRYLFNIYEKQARLEEVLGGPLPLQPSDKE